MEIKSESVVEYKNDIDYQNNKLTIEQHEGIFVLRDDLLPGGTKSVLLPGIVNDEFDEYVYASPVYGGFQIALSLYCARVGKKATIFCAARKAPHANTVRCKEAGAKIIELRPGYLSVAESRAREYCAQTGAKKLEFGARNALNEVVLMNRVNAVVNLLGKEPDLIVCAVGSGLLIESIIGATNNAAIAGCAVGMDYLYKGTQSNRVIIEKYPAPFDKECAASIPFPSMPNYDRKAWVQFKSLMDEYKQYGKTVLFWNVL